MPDDSKASADARRGRERVYSGHFDARDPSSRALARRAPRPSVACGARGFRDLTAGGKGWSDWSEGDLRERVKVEGGITASGALLCPTTVRHYLSVKEACFRLREENDYEGGVEGAAVMQLEPRSRQHSPEPNRLMPKPGVRNEKWETVNVTGELSGDGLCHPRPLFRAWVTRPALGKAPDVCACNPFALVPWTTLACIQSPERYRASTTGGGNDEGLGFDLIIAWQNLVISEFISNIATELQVFIL